MSISASLANAMSGLTAAARASQLVSNNVANVMTEGYGTREISLSSRTLAGSGAGVQVDGAIRVVDQGLLRDRRLADAALGFASGQSEAAQRIVDIIGTPENGNSISGLVRTLETALQDASSRPDAEIRLNAVLGAATDLASGLETASDAIQTERLNADSDIARQVDVLNQGLRLIQDFNAQIASLNGRGRDVTGLEDQRQAAIDRIAEIVPIREVPREDGKVSIYTTGGAILLDDTPRQVEFTPVNFITPDMTIASGALSGLSIDGRPVATSGDFAPLGGGSLAAAFMVRDAIAPEAQARLDSFARDLVERFADPAVDPTLAATDPGLFTDGGAAFDPLNEVGLSGRLTVNALVDPAQGGELRRIRDGLNAAVPGPVGNGAQINALSDALTVSRAPSSTAITSIASTASSLAAELTSLTTLTADDARTRETFATASQTSLRDLELRNGVDTDRELQKLLLIERSYAANARVIETVDSMIQSILAI